MIERRLRALALVIDVLTALVLVDAAARIYLVLREIIAIGGSK